jgi:putative transposase
MSGHRRVADDQCYAHFLTFSVYHRRRLLDLDEPKRILLGVLAAQLHRTGALCFGYVVMPNHVHAIVQFPRPGELSRFVQSWKRVSSYQIQSWYRANAPTYLADVKEADPFWQKKYYSLAIYNDDKVQEKLAYMHANPVRASLVDKPDQWSWSSAKHYEHGEPAAVPIHRPVG